MRGIAYAITKRQELGLGNRRLDQREDLVLLEAEVQFLLGIPMAEERAASVAVCTVARRRCRAITRA